MARLCDYFGISRQGYYKHTDRLSEVDVLKASIVLYCTWLKGCMPKAGMRELYACCLRHFGEKMVIGRDQCYALLRANGLSQRKRRPRPRTTNSAHNYYIYPDLLNTIPKYTACRSGLLAVADITYVPTAEGWAYLSLLTDAFSRAIVGFSLQPTLSAEGPMEALQEAFRFYAENGIDIKGLIHHSDRGAQYCSNRYIELLKEHGVRISMTQCGDPLHNALAERMNNTIKNGWLFDCEHENFKEVEERIRKAVDVYNNVRPHQALGMRTPMEAIREKVA